MFAEWTTESYFTNENTEAQSRNINFPRPHSQEMAGCSNPQDLVLLGVRWKKPSFQWQGAGAGWGRGTLGRSLFLHQTLCLLHGDTHCPPAEDWTAGLGAGGHEPGCHSGSGSRSGHSAEPVGSQRAEVRAIPEMGGSGLYSPYPWSRLLSL